MATKVMVSRNSSFSTLDPNAPIFVPAAYRVVEDFSEQWWSLVDSSPWFRDYWLTECFSDPQINDSDLPEIDDLFDGDFDAVKENDEKEENNKALISLGVLKWRKHQPAVERRRYGQKAPKIVNVKVSPRPIQQPR